MKTFRVWNGCKVVGLLTVTAESSTFSGATGAAADSTPVDIEIDPWAGLIVDHGVHRSPVNFREKEA